ncbi:MAG: AMP-dependent synthetase [Desulfobulbus propionicus]|nr:MAG: AMP-dependent synthetase [Desulfobulbus propionicus]
MTKHALTTPLETLFRRQQGHPHPAVLDRSVIEHYQLARLRETMDLVKKNAPYYQHSLRETSEIGGLSDLASLPLLTEQDIRKHGQQMICVSQDAIARIVTIQSSGTTGPPKRLFFTRDDLEQTLQFFQLGMQAIASPGQRAAILLPGHTPDSTGELLARALRRLGAESVIIGLVTDPFKAARELATYRPHVVIGFPVQLLALVRCATALCLPLDTITALLLCSDYIPESLCVELEKMLGCSIFSHYGTVETGLGGAVDCQAHQGLHLREGDLLVEIIDPHTLENLPDGTFGEIVVTTLSRKGMPLIRYRTGDRGRLLTTPCPCTSHLKRLDKVQGRLENNCILEDGSLLNMQMLDELLFPLPGILDINAALTRKQDKERLILELTVLPDYARETTRLANRLLEQAAELNSLHRTITCTQAHCIHSAKRIIDDKRQDEP